MKLRIKLILSFIIFLFIISIFSSSKCMLDYQIVGTSTGIVTASSLNVRKGSGTNFEIITRVNKNEYIRIFAKINDWYVIQTNSNYLGAVSSKYVKLIYPTASTNNYDTNNYETDNWNTGEFTQDEKEVINLINQKRIQNDLTPLKIDDEVQNIARIKAQEMVDKNYFSHTSPTYGSPFDMMNNFGITYKTAGENIAGNPENSGAVEAWMNSSRHRANILNNNYNYTGIGIAKSQKYGKVFVQMFIGK